MSVLINVNPDVLSWVKNQVLPTDVIATLNDWISGAKVPNVKAIRDFSKKTHIPFGFFFMKTPPEEELSIAHCRTIGSSQIQRASRELIDTFNSMVNIKDWMSEYNKRNGFDELSFVGAFTESDNVNTIAHDIRQKLELQTDWFTAQRTPEKSFSFLRSQISNLGVLILQNGIVSTNTKRKLSVQEFRAFTLLDKYAPLIFINSNDSHNGKVFSLIHELAHIWIGKENLFNDSYFKASHDNHTEQICNAIAAEILVPHKNFLAEWSKLSDIQERKIIRLSDFFKCSVLVIARRALDFQLIAKALYDKIVSQTKIAAETYPNRGRGNFYSSLMNKWDKKIILALDSSTKSGEIQYLEAYRLTDLKGDTFHALVEKFHQRR